MYVEMTTNQMVHTLLKDEYANWSYEGATALIEYLEEFETWNSESPLEFDPVALRCEFTEFTSWDSVCGSYEMSEEEIKENTLVIEFDRGVILQEF